MMQIHQEIIPNIHTVGNIIDNVWLKLNISACKKTTLASNNNNLTLVHNTDMRKNFLGFGSSSSTKLSLSRSPPSHNPPPPPPPQTFGLCSKS